MEELNNLYLDAMPGRTARVGGREFLFFSGYNYLGINNHPEFNALLQEGVRRYGWLFPSSRISNTRLRLYDECEAMLAKATGCEAAVLLPTGFTAGRVATSLPQAINNSPASHPAILRHKSGLPDIAAWQQQVLNSADESEQPLIIASDSANPLAATIYDFSFLERTQRPLTLIVDDSHGVGLIGGDGFGTSASVPKQGSLEYIFTYSLSKAFGISGGAISCTAVRAAYYKSLPAYTGSTPISPAQGYAFINGQHIYAQQREKLRQNIAYFAGHTRQLPGVHYTAGFPVFVLPAQVNEKHLYDDGIIISSFAYPTPNSPKLNRIVVNAGHTPADLDRLAEVLHRQWNV
ncbi:aminotransferase class I/II-fold pyridoxal phosphate-dependent enzyme [Mucilaginibacter sp. CSA2-8R]|uniref:aminotransferase class I/II-fold pyridoxal phosphate-dependent enzyme n=1 Tax=Mucilaginibacter sp. CSA2-8R TaxID=3141542 RepID=UPI00315C8FA6